MKKLFAGLMAVCMLASGTIAFAADEAVVDDDMLIIHEAQGDIMPISEDAEAVEVAEETEEVTGDTGEEEAEVVETVAVDTEAMVKNIFVLDGKNVELAEGMGSLVEKDGVVFVPARAALEAVGFQVSWAENEQMVMGANQETGAMFIMQIDNTLLFYLTAEGEEGKITMEAAPFKNEAEWRTYVPLSDFAKVLGFKVGFDTEAAIVTLSK